MIVDMNLYQKGDRRYSIAPDSTILMEAARVLAEQGVHDTSAELHAMGKLLYSQEKRAMKIAERSDKDVKEHMLPNESIENLVQLLNT